MSQNPLKDLDPNYSEVNRKMWNQTADIHKAYSHAKTLAKVSDKNFSSLDKIETQLLIDISVKNKDVAQLSCNNGRELISVKKMGAAHCVGFDISDAFIAQAQELTKASGEKLDFICTNVYEISKEYYNSFDIVYVTVGSFGWLADIQTYFQIVAYLLRPEGKILIYEMHPMLDMFDAETGMEVKHSYFRTEPDYEESFPDYLNPDIIVDTPSYWFHHKTSDIISAVLDAGLTLEHFKEYPHDISENFKAFQDFEIKPAMCYSLIASKNGT